MQLFDRIFCDACHSYIGQLVSGRASFDQVPHLPGCFCPDCKERDIEPIPPDQLEFHH